jgi:hypothetical protein
MVRLWTELTLLETIAQRIVVGQAGQFKPTISESLLLTLQLSICGIKTKTERYGNRNAKGLALSGKEKDTPNLFAKVKTPQIL